MWLSDWEALKQTWPVQAWGKINKTNKKCKYIYIRHWKCFSQWTWKKNAYLESGGSWNQYSWYCIEKCHNVCQHICSPKIQWWIWTGSMKHTSNTNMMMVVNISMLYGPMVRTERTNPPNAKQICLTKTNFRKSFYWINEVYGNKKFQFLKRSCLPVKQSEISLCGQAVKQKSQRYSEQLVRQLRILIKDHPQNIHSRMIPMFWFVLYSVCVFALGKNMSLLLTPWTVYDCCGASDMYTFHLKINLNSNRAWIDRCAVS